MRAHVNATGSSTASNPPRGIPVTFKDVFADEIECISDSRRLRKIPAEPTETSLIGLAFSGGGIRSATFNLGILQALAENRLLHKFDYLSTVSGGGYIGSWLAALTRRFAAEVPGRSEEHTSELQSQSNLVCRLLLEKKNSACTRPGKTWHACDGRRLLQRAPCRGAGCARASARGAGARTWSSSAASVRKCSATHESR